MQSIRAFKCAEMPDKVMRAKFIHKVKSVQNKSISYKMRTGSVT